jgi:RNA polymerase sigma factor (sigma-70 family)
VTAPAVIDDATLARGVAAGDTSCLAAIYDRYAGPLFGFCQNMLRRPSDAEDCLQDVFVIAATHLSELREPALLRSWLYSIARHECLRRLDRRNRELLMDDVPDRASAEFDQPAPSTLDTELATLIEDMNAGLSERDRLLLELSDRQGLSGDELAGALGVSRATAYTLVGRARATARTSIGALLVARTGRDECPELDQLLTGWDGQLTTLRRKQIARHIDKCDICSERRKRVATPLALLGEGTAFAADLVAMRLRILTAAAGAMVNVPANQLNGRPEAKHWPGGWPPADPQFARSRRWRWLVPLSVLLVLLLISGGVVVAASTDTTVQGAGAPVVAIPISTIETSPPPAGSSIAIQPTDATAAVGGIDATTASAPAAPPTPSLTATPTPTASVTPSTSPSTTPSVTPSSSTATSPVSSSSSSSSSPPMFTVTVTGGAADLSYGDTTVSCASGKTCATVPAQTVVTIMLPAGAGEAFSDPPSCNNLRTLSCAITITANTAVTVRFT